MIIREENWCEPLFRRLYRRLELLRGRLLCWRGANAGLRFGLGPDVRVFFPHCLTVGNDVTFEGPAYLNCLSERGVIVGNHSSFAPNLWLHCGGLSNDYSHGYVEIGDFVFVGANGVLGAGGGIRIGNHVLIGQCVNIHAENHIFADPKRLIRTQGLSYAEVIIEDDVWVGSKATILAGARVGKGAVIGAGAVVTGPIPAYAVAVGVPARVTGYRRGDTN